MNGSSMFSLLLILSASASYVSASAIPMWELLSKAEKLSYLYSMFAYQVEEFCEFSEAADCSQDLLKYGLAKLKSMPEDSLDTMDPYQRGASSIIWNSIMEGHRANKPKVQTTTAAPNFENNLDLSFGDELGSQGLASAKIDNVVRVPPPADFKYETPKSQYVIKTGTPEYKIRQPAKNALPFEDILHSTALNDDIDNFSPNTPLSGPMVVRVRLDGTPVDDTYRKAPQDEDLKHHKLSQILLPSL
ncbi:hypothetical protein PPYR_03488 [Photinus pyralis]|uniref:Rhythmically expressed gene 5 protein n=1 Tax=Photinus pyralis TaxID=7054 RepID=A0A5N4A331_PHOPY|nr:rhythmically expressed gene 5 protein [Photinus pyralis]KAB0791688.1 hypothetical protein PPYR_03488 [Photinus pyralis]